MKNNFKAIFSFLFLLLFFTSLGINNLQLTVSDSIINALQSALKTDEDDTSKVATLNKLSIFYITQANYNKAILCANQALEISQKREDKKMIALSLRRVGNVYHYQSIYEKAIGYYLEALKLAEETQDTVNMVNCYNNLGNEYASIGSISSTKSEYEKALQYHLHAITLLKKTNYYGCLANSFLNIGGTYRGLGQLEKALDYYFGALKEYTLLKEANGVDLAQINIGETYMELAKKTNNQNDYKKAEEFFSERLKIYSQAGATQRNANLLVNIGEIRFHQNKINEAIEFLSEGINMAQETKAHDVVRSGAELLSEVLQIKGDYKQALEYHKLFSKVKDTLLNEKSSKQITEMGAKYESEKKDKENEILSQENEIQKYKINHQNSYIYALLASMLLIMLFTFLFIRQNKLQAKQKTLELKQKLLRTQMNPHFIFNSLNAIQSYIYKNDPQNAGNYLSKFASLIRMILDNSRQEYVSLEKELNGLNLYLSLQALRFDNKFDYFIEVDPGISSESIAIPPMLAQPFIENAIEHGLLKKKEKGKITIRFILKENFLLFEVEDDGIGREQAEELKQFGNGNHVSLATAITKERLSILNKGIRKKIILTIVDLKEPNGVNKGTKVIFNIPFIEI
jgi:tetratricopeptide (TPR) repeat protein